MDDHIITKTIEEEDDDDQLPSESVTDVNQSDDINEELLVQAIDDQEDKISPPKPIIVDDILHLSPVLCPNLEDYLESYRSNTKKEELILTYTENFRRQYHHIYRHRKPLFLNPLNECGIPKFVCTTIRPTMLPYSDLTEWNLTASFIADHLNYDLLNPPYELPKVLWSPTKILIDQHGNCFDYANLLCSLLIGAGYDAYIVSGYGTREICYMDTTRLPNPYIRQRQEEREEQLKSHCQKYGVKLLKDLTSKYDAYMQQRHLNTIQAEKNHIENEENKRIAEIERPLMDPLDGIRIHAWVLILPGKHDIYEAFYLEPTTGHAKTTDDNEYLGIESVWNHQNLWVNMQDCSNGCKRLQFDLSDQARWECMFPSSTKLTPSISDIPNEHEEKLSRKRPSRMKSNQLDWFEKMKFYFTNPLHLPVSNMNAISYYHNYSDQIKAEIYRRYHTWAVPDISMNQSMTKDIDLPSSWVHSLDITPQNFQKRYPNSRKIFYFKKTCVEKYAPYSMKDGLVLKVLEFDSYDLKELLYGTYYYEHRHDKLDIREHDVRKNMIYETYRPGRSDHLKEYNYNLGPIDDRTMIYYYKSRLNGLSKRHETSHELTEYFIDHDDFLAYRKVVFDTQSKRVGPARKDTHRSILSIIDRFNRNPSVNSNDDIQELLYAIKENKFIITYHRDMNYITPSIRTYIKPPNWNDKAFIFKWNDDLEKTYQADEDFKQMSKRDLYYQMLKLIEQENVLIKQVRQAEVEIRDLQSRRQQEELASDLEVSIYDMDRNEKSKIYKELLQQKADEEMHKINTDELDYLAPYLAALGNPQRINAHIAEQIRYTIKLDFQNQSIYKANTIQSRYETKLNLSKTDEFECEQSKFTLEILEERLKQHQEFSRTAYLELEHKLQEDPRLKEPYIVR